MFYNNLLTDEFINKYPDTPEHMSELGTFVFYRTYSRWLEYKGRRETWKEAIRRAVEYNVNLGFRQIEKNKINFNRDKMRIEAETLFDNIFNLRQFLSGRTHWVGGAESNVADKFPLANFNCSFINIKKWKDISNLFYLLLIGTGVGIKCTKENAKQLTKLRTNLKVIHSEYNPLSKSERIEHTRLIDMKNGYAKIWIGDSKEGFVEALKYYIDILHNYDYEHIHTVKISYNSIRPQGERLRTFGGTASGHLPLKEMFEGINKVIKGTLYEGYPKMDETIYKDYEDEEVFVQPRPIHILDICNLIGANVVVGGVRRTAEIFLCDDDDEEVINAKCGINSPDYKMHHRRMSNNSICFKTKPTKERLTEIFELIKTEGEPGFINFEAASKRRPNMEGVNPCGEVLLDSNGVCNLTTVNVRQFVTPANTLDFSGLMQAQALSVRAGLRMACIDLELPEFNFTQKRDRLIACSLTGWKDAMEALEYDSDKEKHLLETLRTVAFEESLRYSNFLRIPIPLLTTTIKPEGTLSQVAGGVSPGLHENFAPFYIRRIRINASDPLVKVAKELEWTINPEVGTPGNCIENARTLVIDFPVKSETKKQRGSSNVKEQLENYFSFQTHYTDHNSSNTIYVKDDEWDEVLNIIYERWDEFIGVTFLPLDGGTYQLAPYEEITEEKYYELKNNMKPFDSSLLSKYESKETELEPMDSCETGVCPLR